MEKQILEWLANGETGTSSKAMAFAAAGVEVKGPFNKSIPSDPDDFNRCLKLVAQIPIIRAHFIKIAQISEAWNTFISNWDAIEKSFLDEVGFDWCDARSAPLTYGLMKELESK